MARRIVAALFFIAATAAPSFTTEALAQNDERTPQVASTVAAAASTVQFAANDQSIQAPREIRRSTISWTTPVLAALQATTLATQALDIHSTLKALDQGAIEANPMMSGVVKNRAAFIGVKAAMGATLMYATHKLARRHKVAAILTSAAINSTYLFVASHNYRVARSLR